MLIEQSRQGSLSAGRLFSKAVQKAFGFEDSVADSPSVMLGGIRFDVDRYVDLICDELASDHVK